MSFEKIYYRGEELKFYPEHSHFYEKSQEMSEPTFTEKIEPVARELTIEERDATLNSKVLMDRVLKSDKWDKVV